MLDIANILGRLLRICQSAFKIWRADAGHDDLIGEDLPGFTLSGGVTQLIPQPILLHAAQHGAFRILDLDHRAGRSQRHLGRFEAADFGEPANLIRAARQPGFETDDRGNIAKVKAAIQCFARAPDFRIAHWHPFQIGLHSGLLAVAPIAFARLRIMVLSAGAVGIIGAFMIVPGRDPRG